MSAILGKIERHLGPDADDELFAKAMTSICDGFPPDCSFHQTCLHDGDCFRGNQSIAAARAIETAALAQDGGIRTLMLKTANALRTGEIDRSADVTRLP